VGSDVDVIVVVQDSDLSPLQRHVHYDPRGLPVPADLWVYTSAEWEELSSRSPQLWQRLQREMLDLTIGDGA
jgi:hypothetical protein